MFVDVFCGGGDRSYVGTDNFVSLNIFLTADILFIMKGLSLSTLTGYQEQRGRNTWTPTSAISLTSILRLIVMSLIGFLHGNIKILRYQNFTFFNSFIPTER